MNLDKYKLSLKKKIMYIGLKHNKFFLWLE